MSQRVLKPIQKDKLSPIRDLAPTSVSVMKKEKPVAKKKQEEDNSKVM